MKTRNGFVSNSSTSSFLIVAEYDIFMETVYELPPLQRALVEELGWRTEHLGPENPVALYQHMTGNHCSFDSYGINAETVFDRAIELGWTDEDLPDEDEDPVEWMQEGDDWYEAPKEIEEHFKARLKGCSIVVEDYS